ncbi:MAG: sigma-E factor negative regulatory protein [Burkholderiaceae bacterium]|nr:sigma-E factor negative regulatory protein [Sulfuritalea sp.]MCF8174557.1 sigma-E factor negative regulatory protein [Burkholderiaceae bacterium]MCF8184882.1 sigma-E factor negative regulatory protein [Polynucleobacter sp.]
MKTQISALMDGELEDHEVAETLQALRRGEELRGQWCDCQLIGAALRGEGGLHVDVVSRVMSAIDLEPTVMAPQRVVRVAEWRRPALALAASAAGVALVVWLALTPGDTGMPAGGQRLADSSQGTTIAKSMSTPRLQEYLVAHQAYAPAGAMVGGARNIRTVAASGEGR